MSEDQTKNKTKDEILKKLKDIENKIESPKQTDRDYEVEYFAEQLV